MMPLDGLRRACMSEFILRTKQGKDIRIDTRTNVDYIKSVEEYLEWYWWVLAILFFWPIAIAMFFIKDKVHYVFIDGYGEVQLREQDWSNLQNYLMMRVFKNEIN